MNTCYYDTLVWGDVKQVTSTESHLWEQGKLCMVRQLLHSNCFAIKVNKYFSNLYYKFRFCYKIQWSQCRSAVFIHNSQIQMLRFRFIRLES